MKLNKGAIFASVSVMMFASLFAGAGTMAYFSQTETVGITFAAGTPNLRLSKDYGSTWGDSLSMSFPVWAPGDTCSIEVWAKNIGNVGLANLYVSGNNLAGTKVLSDVIQITDVAYTDTIGWVHPAGGTYYGTVFGDDTAPFTLRELANGVTNNEYMKFCWGDGSTDYLPADAARIQRFYIEFTFDPNAGNEYQGKSVSFNLVFVGTDDPFVPVWTP